MIDLKEPARPSYTPEEEKLLKEKFVLLLHTFLLVYLTLHNFLIPLVNNLFQSEPFWLDMHFWFLAQLPLHYLLRRKESVPHLFFAFLLVGSFTRLVIELGFAPSIKSWTLFSVVISEFCTFLFLFVLKPQIHCDRKGAPALGVALLGVLVPLTLSNVEVRSQRAVLPVALKMSAPAPKNSTGLGCAGSALALSFPMKQRPALSSQVEIRDCGFASSFVGTDGQTSIVNKNSHTLNLRLYKLKHDHRRVSWKFMRLVQLRPGDNWDLARHLKKDELYLVKAPERRSLGHLVLLPSGLAALPMGEGTLNINFDSVSWTENKHE